MAKDKDKLKRKKFKNFYKTYEKEEYGKRLINLDKNIKFSKKRIKKLYRKHGNKKNMIMFRCLNRDNFLFYLICVKKFKIDKRLTLINYLNELAKYRTDNVYFKDEHLNNHLLPMYKKYGSTKYSSNSNTLLDFVTDELLIQG